MKNLIKTISISLIMSTMGISAAHATSNTTPSANTMQQAVSITHQMKLKYPTLNENETLLDVITALQQTSQHVCGECHTDDGSPGTGMASHGHVFCMKC